MRINPKSSLLLLVFAFLSVAYSVSGVGAESQPFMARLYPDGVQRVDVKVDSFSFEPNHIVVLVNKPVELRFRSVTSVIPHNFAIAHSEAGLDVGQDIRAGRDVKVAFTPTMTGSFEFYCDKKELFGLLGSHKDRGMKGILEVKDK